MIYCFDTRIFDFLIRKYRINSCSVTINRFITCFRFINHFFFKQRRSLAIIMLLLSLNLVSHCEATLLHTHSKQRSKLLELELYLKVSQHVIRCSSVSSRFENARVWGSLCCSRDQLDTSVQPLFSGFSSILLNS